MGAFGSFAVDQHRGKANISALHFEEEKDAVFEFKAGTCFRIDRVAGEVKLVVDSRAQDLNIGFGDRAGYTDTGVEVDREIVFGEGKQRMQIFQVEGEKVHPVGMFELQEILFETDWVIKVAARVFGRRSLVDGAGDTGHLILIYHVFEVIQTQRDRKSVIEEITDSVLVLRDREGGWLDIHPIEFAGTVTGADLVQCEIVVGPFEMQVGAGIGTAVVAPIQKDGSLLAFMLGRCRILC